MATKINCVMTITKSPTEFRAITLPALVINCFAARLPDRKNDWPWIATRYNLRNEDWLLLGENLPVSMYEFFDRNLSNASRLPQQQSHNHFNLLLLINDLITALIRAIRVIIKEPTAMVPKWKRIVLVKLTTIGEFAWFLKISNVKIFLPRL